MQFGIRQAFSLPLDLKQEKSIIQNKDFPIFPLVLDRKKLDTTSTKIGNNKDKFALNNIGTEDLIKTQVFLQRQLFKVEICSKIADSAIGTFKKLAQIN